MSVIAKTPKKSAPKPAAKKTAYKRMSEPARLVSSLKRDLQVLKASIRKEAHRQIKVSLIKSSKGIGNINRIIEDSSDFGQADYQAMKRQMDALAQQCMSYLGYYRKVIKSV